LFNGSPINDGGGFKNVSGQVKSVGYLRDFGQRKGKVSFSGIRDSNAPLPLSESINLGFLTGTESLAVYVAVMPVNHCGKSFIVNGEG
jgi:hypothetical protein